MTRSSFTRVFVFLMFTLSLSLYAGIAFSKTESTVPGKIRVYLYQEGTGSQIGGINNLYASIGDTISVEVYLNNNRQEPVTGLEVYLTIDETYFDIVSQGKNNDGSMRPFIKGRFMEPAANPNPFNPVGNYTHGDSLTANDNGIDGWQMDYVIVSPPLDYTKPNGGRPVSIMQYGTACSFQLIAKAPCDSATIKLDEDHSRHRISRYSLKDSNNDYFYNSFVPCYITVTGIELNPPIQDKVLTPGAVDSSLDLDEHIGVSSIPDSLFEWSVSGNNSIGVVIDPVTHIVTFTVPEDFQGFEDITFTVTDKNKILSSSDVMRVTVDEAPAFTAAVPDTVFIHEDSLEVALYFPDIVADPDDDYDELTMLVTPGKNLTYTTASDTLYLKGKENFNGDGQVRISVYDQYALGDSLTVPVYVFPVNDPPVLSDMPDVSIERNETYLFNMADYAKDADGDTLHITWETPEYFTIQASDMLVTVKGAPSFIGAEELTFTVTDPSGLTSTDTMEMTVTPATKPPVWTALPKIGFAQNNSDSTLVLWNYVSDPDDPDSLLTFKITNEDDVDFWEVNYRNGKLYLYDIDNQPGWDRLTVSAYDPDGNFSSTQFITFIAPADGTPIVGGIPDTTIVAGTQSNWIDLDNYYYDLDNIDSQMTWTWGRMAGADSSATVFINPNSHVVRLSSISPDLYGRDKIFFTVNDPTDKVADDICDITVLEDLLKPRLFLPSKIGFIAGERDSLDLDDYVTDAEYPLEQLTWDWGGDIRTIITLETPDAIRTRPVSFTGPADWTGWERVDFEVTNPMGGTAADTLTVFSVSADGTPVAGGLINIKLKAGRCISFNLDDYYWDADSPDYSMTWSVAGGDSIIASIDQLTHIATVCALSGTWQGQETLTFTVTDPDNKTATMEVPVIVTDAVLRNVLKAMIFRNPMQEDYMDIFITGSVDIAGIPTLAVRIDDDTSDVKLATLGTNYYYGRYLLPLDISLGTMGTASVLMRGTAVGNKAVQDTTLFAYGRIGEAGGKIAVRNAVLTVPPDVLVKPVLLTLTPESAEENGVSKGVPPEVEFAGDAFSIGPQSLGHAGPLGIEFASDDGAEGTGIYRRTEDGWMFAGGECLRGTVRAMYSVRVFSVSDTISRRRGSGRSTRRTVSSRCQWRITAAG